MQIVRLKPYIFGSVSTVEQVVRVYQDAFSGPPWFETWSQDQVLNKFDAEMHQTNPLCLVTKESGQVLGFAWGYAMRISNGTEEKLEAVGLHQHVKGNLFYLSEFAVMQAHQGKGIGKAMFQSYLKRRRGRLLLRTKRNSPMHRLATSLGGITLMHLSQDRILIIFR